MKLEEILNILFQNQVNVVILGDFNVNVLTNNTRKYKIISLLGMYNLDYIVDFPTRIDTYSASSIDNIFINIEIKILLSNHTLMDYPTMLLLCLHFATHHINF
jgi:hypothetical protein